MRIVSLAITALISGIGVSSVLAQAECPTSQSAALGFIVERGEQSKTEVFHVGPTDVRTIYRYKGENLLETTQFQGLFELERIDRGKRMSFRPISDLSKDFPLTVGKRVTAIFEMTESERRSTRTIVLAVKKLDTLHIGPCPYSVIRIDRSRGDGDNAPTFWGTEYYSPDLKLIIAREYKEKDGKTTLNKYDRIYPIRR